MLLQKIKGKEMKESWVVGGERDKNGYISRVIRTKKALSLEDIWKLFDVS